ncbi:hypothetical protein, partial [Picosynechococcus sp. NKBG042902]
GANLDLKFGPDPNSPRLVLGFSQNKYEYSTNDFIDNRLGISFRVGQPSNPFRRMQNVDSSAMNDDMMPNSEVPE